MLLSMPTICKPFSCRKRAVSLPINPEDPVITAIDICFPLSCESRPSSLMPQVVQYPQRQLGDASNPTYNKSGKRFFQIPPAGAGGLFSSSLMFLTSGD